MVKILLSCFILGTYLGSICFQTPKKGEVFDRSTKNRASERYPVPHKKAAKIDQIQDENKPPKNTAISTPTK